MSKPLLEPEDIIAVALTLPDVTRAPYVSAQMIIQALDKAGYKIQHESRKCPSGQPT